MHELETLLTAPYPRTALCLDPLFGPTQSGFCHSERAVFPQTGNALRMSMDGLISATAGNADGSNCVRSVRDPP